jgi:lipoprotein-anchoring transpeptidase ErfK/SrfK
MEINIYIKDQLLALLDDAGQPLCRYAVSTAANGPGEMSGSHCTPRGLHIIRAKIGANCPENTVFVRRRSTGEVYTPELAAQFPDRDWILTRILWLSGCETGFNRLGQSDTMRRYIYIHGTPDSEPVGKALSHGCIRMRNADLIDLFDRVPAGIPVRIIE